jgi:hypothetical protein
VIAPVPHQPLPAVPSDPFPRPEQLQSCTYGGCQDTNGNRYTGGSFGQYRDDAGNNCHVINGKMVC